MALTVPAELPPATVMVEVDSTVVPLRRRTATADSCRIKQEVARVAQRWSEANNLDFDDSDEDPTGFPDDADADAVGPAAAAASASDGDGDGDGDNDTDDNGHGDDRCGSDDLEPSTPTTPTLTPTLASSSAARLSATPSSSDESLPRRSTDQKTPEPGAVHQAHPGARGGNADSGVYVGAVMMPGTSEPSESDDANDVNTDSDTDPTSALPGGGPARSVTVAGVAGATETDAERDTVSPTVRSRGIAVPDLCCGRPVDQLGSQRVASTPVARGPDVLGPDACDRACCHDRAGRNSPRTR